MSPARPDFLRVLDGETLTRPPVWFMRQAGRYLPEYRELRTRSRDFIEFCLTPERAAEATLQPMRRFPFDAAIVFADILLIPRALGQDVRFEVGEGPVLGELPPLEAMAERTLQAGEALGAVGETLRLVRANLDVRKALIGFAGAPWTVATYMLDGRPGLDRAAARRFAYETPERVDRLLEVLVEATVDYLAMQARSGADALKLFESWAEGLPDDLFERLVLKPHQRIVEGLRGRGVNLPLIGFPRGVAAQAEAYAAAVPVQAVALDTSCPLAVGRKVQQIKPIQGALDPLLLRAGGPALDVRIDQLLEAWGAGPWIFNLGHGILPDTPIAHVERTLQRLKG
ncbi:uroporphyrinogen decarboxylase [Brevundimonas sp. 2R-24]|uniref:Uroporphyrinogen decarboxylase n=1 Tax=Peiella sedimenti TaxID=3061083 RepID=A0ABT8SMA9_9CAUL|nr:uroporphyrinogen decarboxylase [Caulobacteraceae bacterium XZ-24]